MSAPTRRWTRRPEGSTWGDFGADDQLGRLNLLTPERVRRAAAEIQAGLSFCLSLPLDHPGGSALAPHRHPPRLQASLRRGRSYFHYPFDVERPGSCDCGNDDAVTLSTQYSTQWDGLAHIGRSFDRQGDGVEEMTYYNGYGASHGLLPPERRGEGQDVPLGIDRMATTGVQGRGVLLGLGRRYGEERRYVGGAELRRALDDDGVVVEEGDVLCLRTGLAGVILEMGGAPDGARLRESCAVLDGADPELLDWIDRSGVAAIAADNFAVEGIPSRDYARTRSFVPLHVHCLFKLGVHLGELWSFETLAPWLRQAGRFRFFLTAPPLRLPGAMGSPVTPIATV